MVASLAEVGSLQMEFNALTRVTGLPKFERAATRAWELLLTVRPPLVDSLLPVHLDPAEMVWSSDRAVSFGANGDSFYEYLLKVGGPCRLAWSTSNGWEAGSLATLACRPPPLSERSVSLPDHSPWCLAG